MHGWHRHLSMSPDLLQEKLPKDWILKLTLHFHSAPPQATFSDFQKQASTPSWVSLSVSCPAPPYLPRAIYWPPSYPVTSGNNTSYRSLLKHETHVIFNFSTVNLHIFNIHSPAAWGREVCCTCGCEEGGWKGGHMKSWGPNGWVTLYMGQLQHCWAKQWDIL